MTENKFNKQRNSVFSIVVVLGIVCVLIGLILLAFNFGWLNPALKSVVFSWPMLFILFAVIGFLKRQRLLPIVFLLIGAFFLLPRLEIAYPGILGGAGKNFTNNFWPFLLIIIGLTLILGFATNRKNKICSKCDIKDNQDAAIGENGWIIKDVIFGNSESAFLEPILKGGDIDIIFGGIVIDLRKTTLPDTTVYLNIDSIFGGITLYVPDSWCVKSDLDSIFGGYNDKRANLTVTEGKKECKLVLQGSLIFSGCTIM